MAEQTPEPDGSRNNALEGLEAALAMLLLARRMRVDDFNLIGSGMANVIFSGEAIEKELAAFSQILAMPVQDKRKRKGREPEVAEVAGPALWQAFKEFALPPLPKKR